MLSIFYFIAAGFEIHVKARQALIYWSEQVECRPGPTG
jgi:hypothetical protein